MSNLLKIAIAGLVVAATAAGLVLVVRPAVAPISQSVSGISSPDIPSPYLSWGGGSTYRITGQCFAGAVASTVSTSTIFVFQNPWSATSTVVFAAISGVNGATSTDIIVATSSTAAPAGLAVATTSIVGNIFGLHNITAATNFNSVAGVTMGPGTGYRAPSQGTYPTSQRSVVLGPLEYVIGFSTSTNPTNNGGIAAGTLGLPASCDYRFDIERNTAIR